jgi:hypothetical protein
MYEEILGGLARDFDPTSKEEIVGGYSVGNTTLFKIKSNIMDWKLLNQTDMSKDKLMQTINDILGLTQYIDNPKILAGIIREIYNLPDKELLQVLAKSLNIIEPLINSLRVLYYTWADLIELLLNILINKIRAPHNPEEPLLTKLDGLDLTAIDVPGHAKAHLSDFLGQLKKYHHSGYCPREPIKRILNLFTFPIRELLTLLKHIDASLFTGVDFAQIYAEIEKIVRDIDAVNTHQIPAIVNRKPLKTSKPEADLISHTEAFLDLYKNAYPALEQKEKKYIEISKKIYALTKVIARMFKIVQ